MNELTIGGRMIGPGHRPFIIAEIGVNHDGEVARALELVEIARGAGADAVKLQIFRADQLMNKRSVFAGYQKDRVSEADPIEMLRRYELSDGDARRVVAEIESAGMMPLATPFSMGDVGVIESLGLPGVKIASPDIVNKPLLRAAAGLGKPMLLSTGAATIEEIGETIGWLGEWNASFALLHCISSYPTPVDQTFLGWIPELTQRFDAVIGYSDHSAEVMAGALAVAAGASILERHLTYDKGAQGPDHSASSDPGEFAEYVRLAHLAATMRGQGEKRVLKIEEDVRRVSRQSLVMANAAAAGQVLKATDLKVQRPGTGIPAAAFERMVGRRLARGVPAGELLDWSMLEATS